jgi:hypothetical protein
MTRIEHLLAALLRAEVRPDDPLRTVDVFADPPEDFESLAGRARVIPVGDLAVPVASIADLIRMKERSGRPLDLADIDALRALRDDATDD